LYLEYDFLDWKEILLRKILFPQIILLFIICSSATGITGSLLAVKNERIMMSEAFRIWEDLGDSVWNGWTDYEISVLLIDDNFEYLVTRRSKVEGFTNLGFDLMLRRNVFVRKLTIFPDMDLQIAVSLPIMIGNEEIIVVAISTADTLKRQPAHWIMTVIHEMFHVFQYYKDKFKKTDSLKIDSDWQLNYPFPYKDDKVVGLLSEMGSLLYKAFEKNNRILLNDIGLKYINLLGQIRGYMDGLPGGRKNYNYMRLLCWKEGVARYTEARMCIAAIGWSGSDAIESLSSRRTKQDNVLFSSQSTKDGYETYQDFYERNYIAQLKRLTDISDINREIFYTIGYGEALLLDLILPEWKNLYFDQDKWLDDLLRKALIQND